MDKILTIQPQSVYDYLLEHGTYQAHRDLCDNLNDMAEISQQWDYAYSWLRTQLVKKTGIEPAAHIYPVWGWLQTKDSQLETDLRSSFYRSWSSLAGEFVILELNLPSGAHLPSEYSAWHFALNGWFLSNEQGAEAFEKECDARGLNLFNGDTKSLPDDVQERVKKSWLAFLDEKKLDQLGEFSPYTWQTVFWEINLKDVVGVRKFKTRGKKS